MIPYGKQQITDDDIKHVIDVLKSDFLTQGPKINSFEKNFANYVGSDYAVAVSNGTAALHLCALALNIKSGDKVITSPITFAASANCISYCQGEVVFSDIDPDTYLMDLDRLKSLLEQNPPGTFKGIVSVDFSGRAIDLEKLRKIANKFDLWIIEDSCHAPGGYFVDSTNKKQHCGNGKFADLSIFSFHPVKHIATGEGGMITTNSQTLYNKLLELRTHGITNDKLKFENPIDIAVGKKNENQLDFPGWYMEMQTLGYNYRLTDIQSALGISQLKRAKKGLLKRKKIAKKYFQAFKNCDKIIGQSGIVEGHAYHLYIIEVDDRLGLYNHLKKNNIFSQVHYIPCHLMPYYLRKGYAFGDFINSENYYKNCLSIPIYPSLKDEEQDFIIDKILTYVNR